jgi:hypothetical protein
MSTDITMQELELESAELLPSRETLCCWGRNGGSTTYVSQVGQGNVIGSGNYDQHGFINVQLDNDNVL